MSRITLDNPSQRSKEREGREREKGGPKRKEMEEATGNVLSLN
jgi:hypothetical protein